MIPGATTDERVYIVLLNWNGWADTIRCVESCLALERVTFTIVVCDNGSTDDSLARLRAFGDERLPGAWTSRPPDATTPEIEAGARLVMIDNAHNLGFAAGCNVGIRFAMSRSDCAFVWVLNNDTVVEATALVAMIDACRRDPRIGICGSQIRFARADQRIQSFGGRLDRWFCTTHLLYANQPADVVADVDPAIDFVPGASMLVTRAYLDVVGPMSEDYFLYFEEIDWAERGRQRFTFHVCAKSVVLHVGGASIGNASDDGERGLRAEWYLLRGRMLFARKFASVRLPVVYAGMLVSILKRLQKRQFRRARVAWCAMWNRPIGDLPHLRLLVRPRDEV